MAKTSREEWAKRVERWQDSDPTAKEFAAEIGVNPRTLSHWKWMLSKGERPTRRPTRRPTKKRGRKRPAVQFTEVTLGPSLDASGIEIVVDSRRVVRVGSQFDDDALRRVLDVVEVRA